MSVIAFGLSKVSKMFAYILLCLGLLHRSFLLIFGQEIPKGMCLVIVSDGSGPKAGPPFSPPLTGQGYYNFWFWALGILPNV